MTDTANDEILHLAQQGNLQALSVYLNRHVIPSGAHVKVKQRQQTLHVLIVFMRETTAQPLLESVKNLLSQLAPPNISAAKIYIEIVGAQKPTLVKKFAFKPVQEEPQAVQDNTHGAPEPQLAASKAVAPQDSRYPITEALAIISKIDDLKAIANHPFFTGQCPNCQHLYSTEDQLPIFWDCPTCGWRDDVSQVIPTHQLKPDGRISLTDSKRIGDYLVEAGLLTQGQVEVALNDQLTTSLRFGELLVRRGWIKSETIEYLMQKVIVPERSGLMQNSAAYVASSRSLMQTLLHELVPTTTAQVPSESMPSSKNIAEQLPVHEPTTPQPATKEPAEPSFPRRSIQPPNERETLILPDDFDIQELV